MFRDDVPQCSCELLSLFASIYAILKYKTRLAMCESYVVRNDRKFKLLLMSQYICIISSASLSAFRLPNHNEKKLEEPEESWKIKPIAN